MGVFMYSSFFASVVVGDVVSASSSVIKIGSQHECFKLIAVWCIMVSEDLGTGVK